MGGTTTDGEPTALTYRRFMFKTIVSGSDGQRGLGAASLAQVIAAATDARLLLVGVGWEPPLPGAGDHAQLRDSLEAELRTVRDELAPDATVRFMYDMSPAHALRRIAKEEGADLIVVGSHHRSRLHRLTSTDCAMQVVHGAPCAVAVAPDHVAPCRAIKRIGVGVDGSPESAAALDMALDIARPTGAELYLLAVASDVYAGSPNLVAGAEYLDTYHEVLDVRVNAARSSIDHALARCEGVRSHGDVRVGDPSGSLTGLSADCDLLVLGSRRWGTLRRLAIGSTSEYVMHHAACPVLVPPRGASDEHDETQRSAHEDVVS
jgi:nucleotide-binding universal stress UspA family protein